ARGAEPITLAAAISLRDALPALIAAFRSGREVPEIIATFGGSGELRRQVEAGAPIDAVLFANASTVDQLIQGGVADPATRRVFATNTLVLIGPKGAKPV